MRKLGPSREFAAACGPVPASARALAGRLDPADAAQYVTEQAMLLVFPERADDPLFRAAVYGSALDNIDAMWRALAGTGDLQIPTPLGALVFAETAAEVGVPVVQFERICRGIGVGLVWICWYRAALAYAEETETPLAELVGAPTVIIHAYIDALVSPMLERYDATLAQPTRDHLRRNILRQALDGSVALEDNDVEEALGLTLDAEHVAVLLLGDRHDRADLVTYAREACAATATLTYRHGVDQWIVWFSRPEGFGQERLDRLRKALERAGARAAVGPPASGSDGLGATGRDAIRTAHLQSLLGPSADDVLCYADVRLEAMLLNDTVCARRFVAEELGALGRGGTRLGRLRTTALTWLMCGSHVATAAQLGVHEHTVRNRLAQAEELLGTTLAARRTELLVALRLERMLSGSAARHSEDPESERAGERRSGPIAQQPT